LRAAATGPLLSVRALQQNAKSVSTNLEAISMNTSAVWPSSPDSNAPVG
jgi:hypothetical protein